MNKKIVRSCLALPIAVIFATTASAQDNKPIKHQPTKLSEQQIEHFSGEMCMILTTIPTDNTYPVIPSLENKMFSYFKLNKNTPDYKLKLADAWNEVSPHVICNANNGVFPKQHFYKRALEMNLHLPVLEEFFFIDEVAFPADPNAVEVLKNGSFDTMLDYMDSMLSRSDASARYNIGQIADFRETLVEYYGAKKASEMTPGEIRSRTAR